MGCNCGKRRAPGVAKPGDVLGYSVTYPDGTTTPDAAPFLTVAEAKAEVRMAEMLAGVDGTSSLPARASLMKSDMLQRALGRPNREQIVSMRPNELSTLEAIDLSNGQALTNLLATGAAKLKKRSWSSPEDLTRWLYVSALSREPAPAELKVAAGIVGAEISEQGIADLLWAVCMLPEFQTIR